MNVRIRVIKVLALELLLSIVLFSCNEKDAEYKTQLLQTSDGLTITAEVYEAQPNAPVILLFHQARFSRGEYRSIAPRLKALGFTCISIDQRSGDEVNGVKNKTFVEATEKGLGTQYVDAFPDLELLLKYARKTYPDQKVLVWGSSYSASLALVLASEYPADVSAVLAFSPGAYFEFKGKSIAAHAESLECPVFMTSSRDEVPDRMEIFNAIPHEDKSYFVPELEGYHGSKALWPEHEGNEYYWGAVEAFLEKLKPATS